MKRVLMKRVAVLAVLVVALAGLPGPWAGHTAAQPVHAQSGVVWKAQYFDNPYLIGNPVVEQQQSGLELNWGAAAPVAGVSADNFSARFATDTTFQAGTYRFFILADDSVKLWIDYPPDKKPVLDNYNAPTPGQMLTVDVTLTSGSHHIQVDYREVTGDAYLYVTWANAASAVTPNFPVPVAFTVQWAAQYYNNTYLGGTPALTQSEPSPTHDWGAGAPGAGVVADGFSARWTLWQYFDAGNYTVSVKADDGVRISVDGAWIINEWHGASNQTYTYPLTFGAGQHSMVIELYEQTGQAYLFFNMVRGSGGTTPPPVQQPTGATAQVTAYVLNVRSVPLIGTVIAKINRNEVYAIVGRNADSSWWQVNVNGTVGWVSGYYVNASNTQNVPVTYGGAPQSVPTATPVYYPYGQCPGFLPSRLTPGGWGRVTPGLPNNVRAQPSYSANWIGQIPAGATFQVLGGPVCADSTAWYQVNYGGLIGWTVEGQAGTYWLEPVS